MNNTQTKVGHTPGPWRVGDAANTIFGPKMTDGTLPVTIATVNGQVQRAGGSRYGNAQLIAAAPELLSALQGCHDMLREVAKQMRAMKEPLGHAVMADLHADDAEKAIRKAKGEA